MKVSICDLNLLKRFYGVLSAISVITSLLLIVIEIPTYCKLIIGIISLLLMIVAYLLMWYKANRLQSLTLQINSSELEIKVGNIFEEDGLKVIAFNEYFDTLVDDKVISKSSLNGIYIDKFYPEVQVLDMKIGNDMHLNDCRLDINMERQVGKQQRFKLGTICQCDDYLLTAFSHFDANNRAYLEMQDYINFLLNFWNEVDIVYAGKSVVVPLLGSGITRFKGYENISDQELLEMLVWSFRVSRIRFQYPSKARIIISPNKIDKINLYVLK